MCASAKVAGSTSAAVSFPTSCVAFFLRCTLSQVEIDQALIRDADLLGKRPKVVNRVLVQADRELLLRLLLTQPLGDVRGSIDSLLEVAIVWGSCFG